MKISDLYQHFKTCTGVTTDTRKIAEGEMFFALKGPNFDANAFAEEALNKGAKFAVIDNPAFAKDGRFLVVTDTLKALQDLALCHRQSLTIPVVGLTGSNGKTTSKELLYTVLSQKFRAYATKGNLNNHIGVPLTVLGIGPAIEIAIIEMGANKQGDIKELVEICEPTHGLITNIGKAHLEGFGGVAGVRKGKGELFDFLAKAGGTVFVNGTDPVLVEMAEERAFKEKITYQSPQSFSVATLINDNPFVVFKAEDGQDYQSHLPGKYNFDNMAAALCVGKYFGVDSVKAAEAVAAYNPTNNRSQWIQKGTNSVLMDAYNANPSSMTAAITQFNRHPATQKMVILGDMLELGEDAPAEHAAIGKLLSECTFGHVLLAGPLMQNALVHLPKAYYFPDKFGLHVWLQDHPIEHTHLLVKGSRGMGLESVLGVLEGAGK